MSESERIFVEAQAINSYYVHEFVVLTLCSNFLGTYTVLTSFIAKDRLVAQ